MIENIIQNALLATFPDEYVDWEIYYPQKQITAKFENIKEVLGSPVSIFKGSFPSQKPKSVTTTTENSDLILNISVYKIDIIRLPMAITKKYILKIVGSSSLYQPLTEVGFDLLNRNISLEVELIK